MSIYNPFSSDFLVSRGDDHLRPQGTLSYVAGATDDPLKFMTIPQLLDRACAKHGGRAAAIFAANGASLSWYDLRERSDDVAAGLLALGIGRGDRVGIWAPNRAEWLHVQFGTARIGAILVNINPAYRTTELEYALNKVGCKALIMARRQRRATTSRCCARSLRKSTLRSNSSAGGKTAAAQSRHRARRGAASARCPHILSVDVARRAGPPQPARGAFRGARSRRCDQHPVHQRHDRFAQRRDADAFQHRQQCALCREIDGAVGRRPAVHSRAALSLLRHGARRSVLHGGRRRNGISRREF